MELTQLSKSKNGERIKKGLVNKYLEVAVRRLDSENVNVEVFRKKLHKAFESKMHNDIKGVDNCGICEEEIKSSFMNLMLKRYCINSTFNLGLLSILENSWLGIQPAPLEVTREYLKSINYSNKRRRVEFLSWIIFYFAERFIMSTIIIDFIKTIKRCIFLDNQPKLPSSAIMISDLTNTHFDRNEKNSLISRVVKYYGDQPDETICYLGKVDTPENTIVRLNEPYNTEFKGSRRVYALKTTFKYTLKYIKYMLIGNTIEIALIKDLFKYELCRVNPLRIEKIMFTQSSKWSHELWPIAYNKKRTLIAYGGSFWGFKTQQNSYLDEYCYYRFQKWDEMLHWNKSLAEYEKSQIKKKPSICIIDPITPQGRINSSYKKITTQGEKYILVFDSLPYTMYGKICSNLGERYRTLEVCTEFINDIVEEAKLANINVVIKPKRDIDIQVPYYTFESYFEMLKQYRNESQIQIANKNVDIGRLIYKCEMVISAPFTSTSLYSKLVYNKAAYFYDPSQQLHKDDRGAMNLCLISGRHELKQLFTRLAMRKKV